MLVKSLSDVLEQLYSPDIWFDITHKQAVPGTATFAPRPIQGVAIWRIYNSTISIPLLIYSHTTV